MTNFEKWKEKFTFEDAVAVFLFAECNSCPALESCNRNYENCGNEFVEWAETEAEQCSNSQ